MTDEVFVGGVILAVFGLVFGPFLLPWPLRLHWIVVNAAINPLAIIAIARRRVRLEEVVLIEVESEPEALAIVVERSADAERLCYRELIGTPSSVVELATLQRWRCERIHLLLVDEPGWAATLRGPHREITGLQPADRDMAVHHGR